MSFNPLNFVSVINHYYSRFILFILVYYFSLKNITSIYFRTLLLPRQQTLILPNFLLLIHSRYFYYFYKFIKFISLRVIKIIFADKFQIHQLKCAKVTLNRLNEVDRNYSFFKFISYTPSKKYFYFIKALFHYNIFRSLRTAITSSLIFNEVSVSVRLKISVLIKFTNQSSNAQKFTTTNTKLLGILLVSPCSIFTYNRFHVYFFVCCRYTHIFYITSAIYCESIARSRTVPSLIDLHDKPLFIYQAKLRITIIILFKIKEGKQSKNQSKNRKAFYIAISTPNHANSIKFKIIQLKPCNSLQKAVVSFQLLRTYSFRLYFYQHSSKKSSTFFKLPVTPKTLVLVFIIALEDGWLSLPFYSLYYLSFI